MMSTSPKSAFVKLLQAVALSAACWAPVAVHAGVLNFETPPAEPFVFAGTVVQLGNYVLEGAGTAGLVGGFGTNDACAGPQCPVNNGSTYYSAYDDGYFFLSMANGMAFSLNSLDASFIGAGLASYPSTAALLYITAFDANGIVDEIFLDLAGPTRGNFNFANYDLTGFGSGAFVTTVRFASYACNAAGNCERATNQANFAIDNISTTDVPEPSTLALLGLGLLGLRSFSLRSFSLRSFNLRSLSPRSIRRCAA